MLDGRVRITYVYPDGREETCKAIVDDIGPIRDEFSLFSRRGRKEMSVSRTPEEVDLIAETESTDFASRMESKFAVIRSTPQGNRKLAQIALKRLNDYSPFWLNDTNLGDEKAKAAFSSLDGILAACPLELQREVGGYIKVSAFADDSSRRDEIKRRVQIMTLGLKSWLQNQNSETLTPTVSRESKRGDVVGVSLLRKRIIGIGLLFICIGSMIEAAGSYHGTPSLGWMVALCATWALIVWLWPNEWDALLIAKNSWRFIRRWVATVAWVLFAGAGVIFIIYAGIIRPYLYPEEYKKPKDRDYTQEAVSRFMEQEMAAKEKADEIWRREFNEKLRKEHPELTR